MNLVPLFEEALEFQNYNGTVLSNGKVAVFYIGRTRLADIFNDIEGLSPAENPRVLDNLGMGPIYVNPAFDYEMVVYDAYDNELFSVKKYLLSKGEHSTANVVVTPSEHIAVSAWTIGDVQVYMPYLVGDIGKTYEGILPIVVNNDVNRISANHIPLGVQDPLYFVEDSETACILGCSAQTEIPAELSGKWDNASDVVIANSAQWAEGTEYEAGSNIDITDNVISGKDWSNEINDASAAATAWTDSQGYLTGVDLSEYAKESFVISAIDSATSGLLPTSAFATASGSFITALPADLATTGFVADVSADITAMIPTALTGDYLTKESADTLYQPIGNYLSSTDSANFLLTSDSGNYYTTDNPSGFITGVDIPESANWNSTYNTVHDNSATWTGSTANPQIPVTGINGIKISESGDKVVFEVSGDYYPGDNPSGFITGVDLSDYATTAQVSEKLDTTAFSDVSGTFLTAHQDLSDYQTTAGMTAYMTTADSAEFMTTAERSDYIPTGVSSEFYTTANTANYISEVPDTYLQNTDLSTEDGKVTAISGIPLSAGGDVPEGVMVESGLEYNAVNEISGYNGSAIAQYGAEKQWLQHDDTIVHVANSAQYAFGCNISALQRLMGIDETVLWSGTITATGQSVNLNEPISNFSKLKFILSMDSTEYEYVDNNAERSLYTVSWQNMSNNDVYLQWMRISANNDKTKITINKSKALAWPGGTTAVNATAGYVNWEWSVRALAKVIGIGRKEV